MEHNNNQQEYLNLLSENDFDYLLDKSRWIEKLLYRIHLVEVKPLLRETLEEVMQELERNGRDIPGNVIEKICNRKQDGKYLFGKELPPAVQPDFALRKEIEVLFISTLFRHILLTQYERDNQKAREEFTSRFELDYLPKFSEEERNFINSQELTMLFRFERGLLLAKNFMCGKRRKLLLLGIGNCLERDDLFVKYITGSHATKETSRRIKMIEHLFKIVPGKRRRKPVSSSSPSSIMDEIYIEQTNPPPVQEENSEVQEGQKVEEDGGDENEDEDDEGDEVPKKKKRRVAEEEHFVEHPIACRLQHLAIVAAQQKVVDAMGSVSMSSSSSSSSSPSSTRAVSPAEEVEGTLVELPVLAQSADKKARLEELVAILEQMTLAAKHVLQQLSSPSKLAHCGTQLRALKDAQTVLNPLFAIDQ